MRICLRLFALIPCCGFLAVAAAQVDSEVQRIRDLVRAGALPRKALVEAETDALARGYRETLRRTLLSDTLEESEIRTMLDAARGLERIARDRFNLRLVQVEAGAVPAKLLQEAKDALHDAERQSELASTRADLVRQMERMEAAETYREELEGDEDDVYRFYGFNDFEQELLTEIDEVYQMTFGVSPPVSAEGSTAMHRAMGLDHTGRIDVALHPDSEEGMFLTYMLESFGIPYIEFRSAIPGQSTGPHIHIGPPSDRLGEVDDEDYAE